MPFLFEVNMKIQEGRVSIKEAVEIGTGGEKNLLADIFLPPQKEKNTCEPKSFYGKTLTQYFKR